jgi:hypothetical protein
MTVDVEQRLREELERLAPATAPLDWSEVLNRAGSRRGGRWSAFAVAACVIAVVAFATPLGAAIAHGLGGFSAWLSGEPGSPVSPSEQRAFDRANARTWLGFPQGTRLRRLITAGGPAKTEVELLGFRSGSTLCLRIVVSGKTRGSKLSCAPLADLRKAGAPVRVVLVDHGFGRGTKRAWYGIDLVRAPALQVTAGIAADGVRRVVVVDDSGRHAVRAASNAFLYVAGNPDAGQRVRRISARTRKGLVTVPFRPAPFGYGGGTAPGVATGPTHVERVVRNGTIGWLDRREPRGQSLEVLPGRIRGLVRRHTVFGRVITPDPSRPVRVAITLSTSRHGGKATGLCSWLIMRSGTGGGCSIRATLFAKNPIAIELSLGGGSDEFSTISGLASDDVARIIAFLANRQTASVPLADNTYLVDIARSRFPVRLVAYDHAGRVIGVTPAIGDLDDGAGPVRGRARPLLHVVSPSGATATLLVGRSTSGGRCMYVRWYRNKHAGGVMTNCMDFTGRGSPLQLGTDGNPTQFVLGRVRSDVATVELRFADGARAKAEPTQGFVLYAVSRTHLAKGHELVGAVAHGADGKSLGSESFRPPRR